MTLTTTMTEAALPLSASYHITKGSLHKGGTAKVEVTTKSKKAFVVKLTYQITKKALIPIPKKALSGDTTIELPPEFGSVKGY